MVFSLAGALKAMACGCPAVSTMAGGPMDFISNGLNGFLAPVGDAKALADAMEEVLSMPESQWEERSNAARLTATQYTWDDAADRFEQALARLFEK